MSYGCLTAARLLAMIAGLALPAPRLFAHGNEYLFARLLTQHIPQQRAEQPHLGA